MKSYRQIFRSSAVIGSSTIFSILVGICKVKVLAVWLGPAGIGVIGLYQNIMVMGATLAGCGLQSSGVRQIASAQEDSQLLAVIRRALLWANVLLGALGMLLLWMMREPLSQWVFHDVAHAHEIGWLGLGVFLSLMISSRIALLQGLRCMDAIAKVNVLGAILGAITGMTLVWLLGSEGLHWFVISAPASSLIFSQLYASRLPQIQAPLDWQALHRQWRAMFSLGIPLMAAGLLSLTTQLVARSWVMGDIGLDAAGYFQAAWSISMTYIGYVLGAMGTDYLPRLTSEIHDHPRARVLVNEQTEMALLMAAPVLLAMLTLAPWVIKLLYADSFAPAAEILRWQVMGDVFKVIGWPMGFIVLAMGRGDLFIATQFNWNMIYLLCLWLGMDSMGLLIVGVGFFVASVLQVGLVRWVVGRLISFSGEWNNLYMFAALFMSAVCILLTTRIMPGATIYVGLLLSSMYAAYSLWRLDRLLDLGAVMSKYVWRR
ncbi:MAG: O-antigen translocase [Sideroxydans sp.]|nr:O-antigen translocase [Sideroxydans sp.]